MDNNEVVTEEVAAVVENNTGIEIEPLFEEQVDFDTFSKSDFRVVKVKNCEAVPKSKKLLRFTLDDGTENERTILSGVHAFYEPEELVGKTLLAIVNLPRNRKSSTTFYDGNRFMWYASFCNSQCKWRRKTESGNVR